MFSQNLSNLLNIAYSLQYLSIVYVIISSDCGMLDFYFKGYMKDRIKMTQKFALDFDRVK